MLIPYLKKEKRLSESKFRDATVKKKSIYSAPVYRFEVGGTITYEVLQHFKVHL